MKKLILRLLFSIIISISAFIANAAPVVFTALPGNSSVYLNQGVSGYVVFGFSIYVPAGQTFNPGNLFLSQTNSINGFYSSILLKRVASADPTLAATGTTTGNNISANNPVQVNQFPSISGGASGTTYYYYLVINMATSANTPPSGVAFSLPSSQTGYSGSANITVNNLATTTTYILTTNIYWKGGDGSTTATKTSWANANNWAKDTQGNGINRVPNSGDNVQIGNGLSYTSSPIVGAATTVGVITFGSSVTTHTLTTNADLTVNGDVSQTASSAITFAGTNSLIIKGALTVTPAVTLTGKIDLTGSTTATILGSTFSSSGSFKTGAGSVSIANDIGLTGGTFSTGSGSFSCSNNFVSASTTVTFGSGNVTSTNTVQLQSGSMTFGTGITALNNALQILGGSLTGGASPATMSVAAGFSNAGTFTPGTGTITFKGAYTNSSTFVYSAGTVIFSVPGTSGAWTLTDNSSTGSLFNNLAFQNGRTYTLAGSGSFSVASTGILTMGGGTGNTILAPAGLLSLRAASTSYAQIATIPTGSSIKGSINYEIYFTAVRGYRSLGSPVYDGSYTTPSGSYSLTNLQSNFIITGPGGASNGFDKSTNNGATVRLYRSTSDDYSFPTTLGSMTAGSGFYMYYRGDRTVPLLSGVTTGTTADPFGSKTNKTLGVSGTTYYTPEAKAFNFTGVPNQGSVAAVTLPGNPLYYFTGGGYFYYIANPYAATLDYDLVYGSTSYTNGVTDHFISTSIWTWNPSGTYGVYDTDDANLIVNNGKRYISPGQGFFIQNMDESYSFSSKTLTFTESMKSTTTAISAVARLLSTSAPATPTPMPITRLQLYKNAVINDEIAIAFKSTAKDSLEFGDAKHFNGDYLNLTTITPDNGYLAIDKRPFTGNKTVIPLFVNAATDSVYSLKSTYNSTIMANYKITLFDSLLNKNTDIVNSDYSFTITRAQAATYGKRFKLIVEPTPAPATFLDLSGKLSVDRKGILNWKTNGYQYGITYQLQRSQDNVTFTNIGDKQVGLEKFPNNSFDVVDNTVPYGKNYYRVLQTDMFDNTIASASIALNNNPNISAIDSKNGFKLYPNPVVDNFSIISEKGYTGKITMTVYSSNSDILFTKQYAQLNALTPVQEYVSQLRTGVYFVELKDESNKVLTTLKFLKN